MAETHPQEVVDRALDLIAKEAAANRGVAPPGAVQRAAKAVGVSPKTVDHWWAGRSRNEGEVPRARRIEEATRAREDARAIAANHLPSLLIRAYELAMESNRANDIVQVGRFHLDALEDRRDVAEKLEEVIVEFTERYDVGELPPGPKVGG